MIGILLANTGSPAAPTPLALRRYLAQFLADRRIVDLPRWLWLPVLHGIILNTRPSRSARLYRRIWTPEGSPLIVISQRIAKGIRAGLSTRLDRPFELALGMRYGDPSIGTALDDLRHKGVDHLLVLPLFPQYSSATTASILDAVSDGLQSWQPALQVIDSYHHHPAYLQALQASIREDWASYGRPRRLLFSFHGVPESYLQRGDPYAQHCQHTASQVAQGLGLSPHEWQVAYQSRFGPARWLQPYTVDLLNSWGEEKLSGLAVICPGFAADCLETLDEIRNEGLRIFQEAGGGEFRYIPALNDRPENVQALCSIIVTGLSAWVRNLSDGLDYSTSP